MVEHPALERAEAFALGILEGAERRELEVHLATGCPACTRAVAAAGEAAAALSRDSDAATLAPEIRAAVLDLAEAPALPLDPAAYQWQEPFAGFRIAVVKEDPARGFRAALIWASPGARYPAHRHDGDESMLVLQGACRDEHRSYFAGEVGRMRAGSTHSVEVLPGEDCIAYVVSHHGHHILEA